MKSLRFIDLFAGLGGFHRALVELDHECVFASEIDDELRELYLKNFPAMKGRIFGDIRKAKDNVPDHDILCAGFPCQPFSKSGAQLGTRDETRGTLFHEILEILESKKPQYVLLENVGNFGRHDAGRTWQIVREHLIGLGYNLSGTEHITPTPTGDWRDLGRPRSNSIDKKPVKSAPKQPKGHGLISPHHFGYPHHRERFFIVATLGTLPDPPFPPLDRTVRTTLNSVVQPKSELSLEDKKEVCLSSQQFACIEHWNSLLKALPQEIEVPSFPLWGDELDARYPFENRTPWATPSSELKIQLRSTLPKFTRRSVLLDRLPSYAREEVSKFRNWKIRYIKQNRDWWKRIKPYLPEGWVKTLRTFPPSLRKLEWNAKGGERNLWLYVLQFRPSGLRVKRYSSSPALVAMTATQIPILGPKERFLTRIEGLRLQGFTDDHHLPASRDRAFKALGNAVHVKVIQRIAKNLLTGNARPAIGTVSISRRQKGTCEHENEILEFGSNI